MSDKETTDMIEVKADKYSVFIGSLEHLAIEGFLHSCYNLSDTFILVDEHTESMCLPRFEDSFGDTAFSQIRKIRIGAGEKNKTLETVTSIARSLATFNASRNAVLINLGGGVLCDIGGFAASIYKRGIDFINIPTTLLAQVDASVGGKVGVDLDGLKNYLGVFNNPNAVYVNPTFLGTLEHRELLAGFTEVVKHGLIADEEYFELAMNQLLEYTPETESSWRNLIARSIEIKNKIVCEDPTEKGLRKVLNFGHTVGHAIETHSLKTDSPLLHGEAVAIGMICEIYLSTALANFNESSRDQVCSTLKNLFDIGPLDGSQHDELLTIMRSDKKNSRKSINFTLVEAIGKPLIDQVASETVIVDALNFYNDLF